MRELHKVREEMTKLSPADKKKLRKMVREKYRERIIILG